MTKAVALHHEWRALAWPHERRTWRRVSRGWEGETKASDSLDAVGLGGCEVERKKEGT